MTNLTPAQLEEFESTFRYFDKDQSNTMSAPEFNAALASLGMFYDDEEFKTLFRQLAGGNDEATFEQVCGKNSCWEAVDGNFVYVMRLLICDTIYAVHYVHGLCHRGQDDARSTPPILQDCRE